MMRYQKLFFSLVVLFGVIGIFYAIATRNQPTRDLEEFFDSSAKAPLLIINDTAITIEVADTPASRTQGLSDREELCDSCGMLFVFDAAGGHGFWMKDMHFDIDIIYLDNRKKIVAIYENVSQDSYHAEGGPLVVGRDVLSRYVLELNAGKAKELGLQVGDVLQW